MKRKSWLFLLYSVLVITAVVLLLVFWPHKDTSTLPENNNNGVVEEDNGNKDNNENDNNEDNPELPIEVYATSLTINLPSTINILKDTEAFIKQQRLPELECQSPGRKGKALRMPEIPAALFSGVFSWF